MRTVLVPHTALVQHGSHGVHVTRAFAPSEKHHAHCNHRLCGRHFDVHVVSDGSLIHGRVLPGVAGRGGECQGPGPGQGGRGAGEGVEGGAAGREARRGGERNLKEIWGGGKRPKPAAGSAPL